jgi:hypothetical protein
VADLWFCWTEICGQEKLTCWRFLYSWTCVTMLPPHFTCTHHSGNVVLLLSAAFLLTTFRCFYDCWHFFSLAVIIWVSKVEFRHPELPDTYIPIFGPTLVALIIICTCKEGKDDSVSVSVRKRWCMRAQEVRL